MTTPGTAREGAAATAAPAARQPAAGRERRRRRRFHVFVFLAPAVAIYTVFAIYPLIESLRLSLFAGLPDGSSVFVGLGNYSRLLFDPNWSDRFFNAFWNNLVLFAVHMVVQNPIGLLLAALLSLPRVRLAATYRTLIFVPTLLSVVIVGFIWQLILSPLWGVAETLMGLVGLEDFYQP